MNQAALAQAGSDAGFSLLEALIALAILAIASAALVGASEAHLDRIDALEDRAVASWVAEEQLTSLRTGMVARTQSSETREMAGRSWAVDTTFLATDDPDLVRVDITVKEATGHDTEARLSGFIDVGAAR